MSLRAPPLWKCLDEAREQLLWGMGQADVVKISDNEVEFLLGMSVEDGATHILENFGVKLVFVTCGAQGCYFKNETASGHMPAPGKVHVVDTTGAGDIFGGAAVLGLLQSGKTPEKLNEGELRAIVRFACAAASLSTEKHGGISSIPSLEDVKQLI